MKLFRVFFECVNCAYEWNEDFGKDDRVEMNDKGAYKYVIEERYGRDVKLTNKMSCLKCRYLFVKITGRQFLCYQKSEQPSVLGKPTVFKLEK